MLHIRGVIAAGTNLLTLYLLPIPVHTRKAVRTAISIIFRVSIY
ncbi:hypothetical protein SAMN04488109_6305 [Chryseolinea serpens]|uniref:Uncharacterized protein n=1 Tax=Chryseolinea serpens TaxID=947013 RepID=A0A1M5XAN9_9BACT|nr:hypothetical protein SAMN04488109_6305 [Chryseolinea serpens]